MALEKIASRHNAEKLKRNIFFQYLLQIAIYVFPFITLPYLTRVLGPDDFAVRAYAASVMAIVTTLVDYGYNTYGTREVARYRDDVTYLRKLASTIFFQRVLLALIGGIIVVAVTSSIPLMAQNPEYMLITYFGYCLAGMLPDFVFQGLEDMSILTKRFVVSKLVSLVLIFAFVRSSEQLILVAIFEAAPSLIAFVWSWCDVIFKRQIRIHIKLVDRKSAWHVFKTSTIFFMSSAATTLFTSLTTIMIGIFITDPAEVSYWSLAMIAVTAVQSLYNPIVNSAYPHMVANRNFSVIRKFLVVGVPVVTLVTVAFGLAAQPIMLVLGGKEYLPGAYVIPYVAPVLLLSYPAMLLGFPVLAAIGREKLLTASSVAAALFHISGLAVLALTGSFTIVSVAVLRSCTEFVLLALRLIFVVKSRVRLKVSGRNDCMGW